MTHRTEKLRMNAYYFSFSETGHRPVDEILSAVACAGRNYHRTEDWGEVDERDGLSYVDRIQYAADRAASESAEMKAINTGLLAALEIAVITNDPQNISAKLDVKRIRAAIAKATKP